MSKPNKVNKTNYDQGGRLTPDEMARERKRAAVLKPTRHDLRGKGAEMIRGAAKATARPGAGRGASRRRSAREE